MFTVRVPSLKCLALHQIANNYCGFVIDTPSLECFELGDYGSEYCVMNNINKIVEAKVCHSYLQTQQLVGSFCSAKRLSLCIPSSKDAYPVGSVFNCLVHLTLCRCETEWLNLLMCVLRDSPNLRALKLVKDHHFLSHKPRPCWNEPSAIPQCMLTSLETLEFVKYEGTEEEKEVVTFILKSGSCLKKVTISSKSTDHDKKFEMLKELSLLFRRSPTCQIVFD